MILDKKPQKWHHKLKVIKLWYLIAFLMILIMLSGPFLTKSSLIEKPILAGIYNKTYTLLLAKA